MDLRVRDGLQLLDDPILPLFLGHLALAAGHELNVELPGAHLVVLAERLNDVGDFGLAGDDTVGRCRDRRRVFEPHSRRQLDAQVGAPKSRIRYE